MGIIKRIVIIGILTLAHCLTAIAQVEEQQFLDAIESYRAQNNLIKAAEFSSKLAIYYWKSEKLEKALQFFEQSVAINYEFENKNSIKVLYSYMGMVCTDMGQPESALVYFRKSLLVSNELGYKQDIGTNLINIAVALSSLNRKEEAIENLESSISIWVELGNKKMLLTSYKMLTQYYSAIGNNEKSEEYFNLYTAFQTDSQNEALISQQKQSEEKIAEIEKKVEHAIQEKVKTQASLEVTQDSLKRSAELNQLQQLKIANQQSELDIQRLLITVFIIGIILIAVVALAIFLGLRQKQKHNAILEKRNAEIHLQNIEIKEKNHEINQSINYAKNIQGAILPDLAEFEKLFPEAFVFFSPRDVVSGDFYWFTEVEEDQAPLKIVVAVDCTGHGVPGAFMSMLGISFIEEIVLDKKIYRPELILEQMHQMVRTALKQEITGNIDGMDMTVCVINVLEKKLYFAGAMNPLVYKQQGELKLVKGDIIGVGGQINKYSNEIHQYACQMIDLSVPTTCYLFSDGFADQFGGKQGRKYFMKNFRLLLDEISEKPMHEQKIILEETLLAWHGHEYLRVDDVLVMGFRV